MQSVPDKSVLQKVNQKLSRMGGAQGKVNASVTRGDVTLSGTIQYEMQRASIIKVATSVPGVRRVIDQLKLRPKEKRMDPQPPRVLAMTPQPKSLAMTPQPPSSDPLPRSDS